MYVGEQNSRDQRYKPAFPSDYESTIEIVPIEEYVRRKEDLPRRTYGRTRYNRNNAEMEESSQLRWITV